MTFHDYNTIPWEAKRTQCAHCHARRGYARRVDGAGYCHACGQFDPNPDDPIFFEKYKPRMRANVATSRNEKVEEIESANLSPWIHVATWEYCDESNVPIFCVDRYEQFDIRTGERIEKTFRQRPAEIARAQKDDEERTPIGGSMSGVRRVLLYLPEVLRAIEYGARVWLCEGEKAADYLQDYFTNVEGSDDCATTCASGASAWSSDSAKEYAEQLRGAHIVLWPDNDEPGERWERDVKKALRGIARTITTARAEKLLG